MIISTREYTIVTTRRTPHSNVDWSIRGTVGEEIAQSSSWFGCPTHRSARKAAKRWLKQNAAPVDQRPAKVKTTKYTMKFEDK